MHTYREHQKGMWIVGFHAADGTWYPLITCTELWNAMEYVSYLNGGQRS
jgi:hypothetical protein